MKLPSQSTCSSANAREDSTTAADCPILAVHAGSSRPRNSNSSTTGAMTTSRTRLRAFPSHRYSPDVQNNSGRSSNNQYDTSSGATNDSGTNSAYVAATASASRPAPVRTVHRTVERSGHGPDTLWKSEPPLRSGHWRNANSEP